MFKRPLQKKLTEAAEKYKAVTVVGPRQAGKTTLCKAVFETFQYFNLESPDIRERAQNDPRAFLRNIRSNALLDEIQRVPELISYLQETLDDSRDKRRFILTGSNSLKLSEHISQSLAGRTRILEVLPLSFSEIPETLRPTNVDEALFFGGYPKIFNEKLSPTEWLGDYYQTYVEKDVRQILNVESLTSFDRFIRLTAGRVGQLMNFSSLGSDAGITQPTANKWMSVLQTSYITFFLQPHFKNFNKHIIKSPKAYFYDTGLLCYLLRIQTPEQLNLHPLRGQIFENWVIVERIKHYLQKGLQPPLYFWRDEHGHEIDLIADLGTSLYPIEIKSGETYQKDFSKHLLWFNSLQKNDQGTIVYGGLEDFEHGALKVNSWKTWGLEKF